MKIGDKMFAYIAHSGQLTQSMVDQYKNSLIFLGDEKQIFNPITGAYVGIGESAYQYILTKLDQGNTDVGDLHRILKNDNVSSIWAQYSDSDFSTYFSGSGNGTAVEIETTNGTQTISNTAGNEDSLKFTQAKRNIVLRGSHKNLNQADPLLSNSDVNSGINVTISHADGAQLYKDENGAFSYSYWYPEHDIITIDDSRTWAYITAQNTYLSEFAVKFATQQANRIYKNILGGSDAVYVEKEINEAFIIDGSTYTPVQPIYLKQTDGTFVAATLDGTTIKVGDNAVFDLSDNTWATGQADNYVNETNASDQKTYPIIFQQENENTGGYEDINLVDGVNTIKEIAKILDEITDGSDPEYGINTGIQLTYSIAKNYDQIQDLISYVQGLNSYVVTSFQADSKDSLLTVTYYSTSSEDDPARGNVNLSLDLLLAQTYIGLNGASYAAYMNIPEHNNVVDHRNWFYMSDDKDNAANYILISEITSANDPKNVKEYYNGITETIPTYTKQTETNTFTEDGTISTDNLVSSNSSKYIYFPYTRIQGVDSRNGLTTVDWVTTYVGWAAKDIAASVQGVNTDVRDYIDDKIDALNASYTASKGKYFTYIWQDAGQIVEVKETELPTDKSIANDVNVVDYTYIPVTYDYASDSSNNTTKYKRNANGGYEVAINFSENEQYYIQGTNTTTFTGVASNINVATLIGNGTSYFIQNSTNGKYTPVDLQASYKDTNLFTVSGASSSTKANTLYYITNSTGNSKYITTDTVHNTDGSNTTIVSSYVTYLSAATATTTGLADAYDVRKTIESMFTWIDLSTNTVIG